MLMRKHQGEAVTWNSFPQLTTSLDSFFFRLLIANPSEAEVIQKYVLIIADMHIIPLCIIVREW